MKNKNKVFVLILCILLIIILIYKIVSTYAIFYSEVNGNIEVKDGTWTITVNGTDITKEKDVSFTIDKVEIEENTHVKQGSLAPGLCGTFNIEINPTNTDVSVRYDITLDKEKIKDTPVSIKSIEGDSLIKTAENTYTGIIPLKDIQKGSKSKISVKIEWLDNEDIDVNNTEFASKYDFKLQIPINVHVIQYLGEEIVPYQGQSHEE